MFEELTDIFTKPKPYQYANPTTLWNDPHISKQMLKFHLDPDNDPASRNKAFLDASVQWLKDTFAIGPSCRILDLGCGPGLYTVEFAASGAAVTGIDVSTNSIRYGEKRAVENNLAITYINADYTACDITGAYDLVTMIYNDYCVLPPEKRKILLEKIYAVLKDEGSFVFDVHSEKYFNEIKELHSCRYADSGGFWSPEGHVVFENIFTYPVERIILQKHTVIEKTRMFTIFNYLKCFTLDEIRRELADSRLEATAYFADVSGRIYGPTSRDIALVCRRMR